MICVELRIAVFPTRSTGALTTRGNLGEGPGHDLGWWKSKKPEPVEPIDLESNGCKTMAERSRPEKKPGSAPSPILAFPFE